MQNEDLIAVKEFCSSHHLEDSFIEIAREFDLVRITTIEETTYIPAAELEQAEKITRMYNELGINMEGIDAIKHLLQKMEAMQQELTSLRNKLSLYEE